MSFMDASWVHSRMITEYGQDIKIYNKTISTDDNGNVISESYSNTIECKGWVIPFSSLREQYGYFGYRVEGDYSCCVENTITTSVNDKVSLADNTVVEIREIINHFEGNNISYKELILMKED